MSHMRESLAGLILCWLVIMLSGCATPQDQLRKAVYQDNSASVAKLLRSNSDLHDASPLLAVASGKGNVEIVTLFVNAGVDVNGGKETPLMAASRGGKLEIVRLLIEKGAAVDKQADAIGIQSVHVETDEKGTVARLRLQRLEGQGNTPLSLAILNKHPSVARYLLEHGADSKRTVAYENCSLAISKILSGSAFSSEGLLNGSSNIRVNFSANGQNYFFQQSGADITTNTNFEKEKKASMKELAETSGNKEIIELFSSGSR